MLKRIAQIGAIVAVVIIGAGTMPKTPPVHLPDTIGYLGTAFVLCFVGAVAFVFAGLLLEGRE